MIASLSFTMKLPLVQSDICVATEAFHYVCVGDQDEAKKVLVEAHGDLFLNRGVQQRIDGSDAERLAVKEILDMMDDYFIHEVFGRQEYEVARGRWCVRVEQTSLVFSQS